ncbi:MAG: GNAT family N-acetyltransferase [Pikeienuella sp.]
MDIQKARPEDASFIRAIAEAAYKPYIKRIGKKPAPMVADFPALISAGDVWCLTEIADIVGYIVMRSHNSTTVESLHIENVAVAPERHGWGFGRALLEFAEAEARRRGIEQLDLYTNAHMRENLAFYAQLGWNVAGRRHEDGFDRVYFTKALPV